MVPKKRSLGRKGCHGPCRTKTHKAKNQIVTDLISWRHAMLFQARPGYARNRGIVACSIAVFLLAVPAVVTVERALAQVGQNAVTPTKSGPNPYRSIDDWGKLPQGRIWGSTSAVDIDPDGSSVWV